MKPPIGPSRTSGTPRQAVPTRVRFRRSRLTQAEVDQAANDVEAASGEEAGVRAVHRELDFRGSLTTVSKMLGVRRREQEAVQAFVDDGGQDSMKPAEIDSAPRPYNSDHVDMASKGQKGAAPTLLEKLLFDVSVLMRTVREQRKALAALKERVELVEVGRILERDGGVSSIPTADSFPQDGPEISNTSKPRRHRSAPLTTAEANDLLAAIIRVIVAHGGSARKHDLHERLPMPWKGRVDKEKVYEFAKARGRVGLTLVFRSGVFTLGPNANRFLQAVKFDSAANNPKKLAKERKAAVRRFVSEAVAHLERHPGVKFTDRALFEVVSQKIGFGKPSYRIMSADTLYQSLRQKFYREQTKLDSGELLPHGRTVILVGDRTFTKA